MNSPCGQSPTAWGCRTLRSGACCTRGRSDILFLVAAGLQQRQARAVASHDGLRKRTVGARVEAHLALMLAFDFEPGVKKWRRACAAQGWYWTRQQQVDLGGELPGPFEPIERDLGPGIPRTTPRCCGYAEPKAPGITTK